MSGCVQDDDDDGKEDSLVQGKARGALNRDMKAQQVVVHREVGGCGRQECKGTKERFAKYFGQACRATLS